MHKLTTNVPSVMLEGTIFEKLKPYSKRLNILATASKMNLQNLFFQCIQLSTTTPSKEHVNLQE